MRFLKRKLLVGFFLIFCSLSAFSQLQLNLNYGSYLEREIEEKYSTHYQYVDDVITGESNPKSIYLLIISNKKELSYFLRHTEVFVNVEKLHIYKVKLKDFSFLKSLKKLRVLSLAQNKRINFGSLVNILNRLPNVKHLYITNKRLFKFPSQINELKHLKSLGIRGTKIKEFRITPNLYYLDLSSNQKMNYTSLEVFSTEVINLSKINVLVFPIGLGKIKTLRALIFSQVPVMKFDCPIKGFKNLEILDIFGSPIYNIKNSCFKDAKKLEIIQQIE